MATPDDNYLIVANAASNELVFLDRTSGEIKSRLRDIADPYQIGFSPDGQYFVSCSLRLHRVDIYSGKDFKLLKRLPAAKTPSHLAYDKASRFVFITLQDTNELLAIDLKTQKEAWRMPIGSLPSGIWMTPDDKHLLIGIMGRDYVEVIDWRTRKQVKKIVTGKGAHNFISAGDGRHVYQSNRVDAVITKIDQDTLTVVDRFQAPGGPDCMDLSADKKELWFTSRFARKVSILDLVSKKVIHQIPVGKSPHGIYLANHGPRQTFR
jgi:DNA-binding beta-propeller fold protein YncE